MAYAASNEKGEIVTEEGYTLAPFLMRFTAAVIDAAFLIAGFWILFFFSYSTTWYPTMREAMGVPEVTARLESYQHASGLLVEKDGAWVNVNSSDYTDYEKAVRYYYFTYNAAGNVDNPLPHGYTLDEYNTAICDLPTDVHIRNDSQYFDFATDEQGNPVMGKEAKIKSSLYDEQGNLTPAGKEGLLNHFRNKYYATQRALIAEPYYKQANDDIFYRIVIVEAYSIMIPFLAFYVIVPLASPYNRTLGKKFMKLIVIDVKGEPLKKYWLVLRSTPFIVTAVAALFLNEFVYSLGLAILVWLISWGCSIFTRKKRALHDFMAHSVVVKEDIMYLPEYNVAEKEGEHDQNR